MLRRRCISLRVRQRSWLLQAEFEQRPFGYIDLLPPDHQRGCASSHGTNCRSTSNVSGKRTKRRPQASSAQSAARGSAESLASLNAIVSADERKGRVVDHDVSQLQLELRSPDPASGTLRLSDSSMDRRSVRGDDEVSDREIPLEASREYSARATPGGINRLRHLDQEARSGRNRHHLLRLLSLYRRGRRSTQEQQKRGSQVVMEFDSLCHLLEPPAEG